MKALEVIRVVCAACFLALVVAAAISLWWMPL